jgi:hypothetical protein
MLGGDGNRFDIRQVNNLIDNKWTIDPSSKIGDIASDPASSVEAHADGPITRDAFNLNITQGADIQFDSITMNLAGHDRADSNDIG